MVVMLLRFLLGAEIIFYKRANSIKAILWSHVIVRSGEISGYNWLSTASDKEKRILEIRADYRNMQGPYIKRNNNESS